MAAVGSSVGLGNLWRFPFTAGENGGGAFIIIYVGCVILLGLPVLMAEYAVGRKSGRSAVSGVRKIAREEKLSPLWEGLAWIGAIASLAIFSFYIVIATWVLDYIPQAFSGRFTDMTAEESGVNFGLTLANNGEILLYLALFMLANVFIVARGIKGGIEQASSILMPLFFVLLVGLVVFAMVTGDAAAAVNFLFAPDFSEVTLSTWLAAVGQAFFSLSVGSVLMVTYGAYLTRDTSIPRSSILIAFTDTFVALIAGLAIFPIVFAFALDPAGGTGLFFNVMPVAFGQMPGGNIIGGIFFTLALFAAFTSSISLFEVGVSWLEDQKGIGRVKGAIGLGIIIFLIATLYVMNANRIDIVDFITGQLLLPLGGVLIALFAGWALTKSSLADELGDGLLFTVVRNLLRYLIPVALGFILVFGTLQTADAYGWISLPDWLRTALGG